MRWRDERKTCSCADVLLIEDGCLAEVNKPRAPVGPAPASKVLEERQRQQHQHQQGRRQREGCQRLLPSSSPQSPVLRLDAGCTAVRVDCLGPSVGAGEALKHGRCDRSHSPTGLAADPGHGPPVVGVWVIPRRWTRPRHPMPTQTRGQGSRCRWQTRAFGSADSSVLLGAPF